MAVLSINEAGTVFVLLHYAVQEMHNILLSFMSVHIIQIFLGSLWLR